MTSSEALPRRLKVGGLRAWEMPYQYKRSHFFVEEFIYACISLSAGP
jgi:hypothetical protein